MNEHLLMSGVDYFDDRQAINPFMNSSVAINLDLARQEHAAAQAGFEQAGITVKKVDPPAGCQDGVYTANWAFILNNKAIMSRLPNARKGEEAYALQTLQAMGIETVLAPEDWLFSGQGDMLYIPGTNLIVGGFGYRSDRRTHDFVAKTFGCEVITLHSIPQRSWFGRKNLRFGKPVINPVSGLADSPAYDIDLAVGILRPARNGQKALIAYCPWLLDVASTLQLERRTDIDKIIVSRAEALHAYACNLVSNGETVILNAGATKLIRDIEKRGLKTIGLTNSEISKGGGGYRCMSLTLDNKTPAHLAEATDLPSLNQAS
jgi:N-dimethylarginine dimethylaminohydrolase